MDQKIAAQLRQKKYKADRDMLTFSSIVLALASSGPLGASLEVDIELQGRSVSGLYQSNPDRASDLRTSVSLLPALVVLARGGRGQLSLRYELSLRATSESPLEPFVVHRFRLTGSWTASRRLTLSGGASATAGEVDYVTFNSDAVSGDEGELEAATLDRGRLTYARVNGTAQMAYRLTPSVRSRTAITARGFVIPKAPDTADRSTQLVGLRTFRRANISEGIFVRLSRQVEIGVRGRASIIDITSEGGSTYSSAGGNLALTLRPAKGVTLAINTGGEAIVERLDDGATAPTQVLVLANLRLSKTTAVAGKRLQLAIAGGSRPFFNIFSGSLGARTQAGLNATLQIFRDTNFRLAVSYATPQGILLRSVPTTGQDQHVGNAVAQIGWRLNPNLGMRVAVRVVGRWRDSTERPFRGDVSLLLSLLTGAGIFN